MNFIVIKGLGPLTPKHFLLTPSIMKWNEDIWIWNLGPTKSYWSRYGEEDLLFEKILDKEFDDFLAVQCHHPWQGLVLLHALDESERRGFYSFNNIFNQKLYMNMSWEHWFAPARDLAGYLRDKKLAGRVNQMRRFIKRMLLKNPFALKQAEFSSIQRRFSSTLGQMWKWTFQGIHEQVPFQQNLFSWAETQNDLDKFPWVGAKLPETPQVKRHLEHPIANWDNIEPLLQEDLDKLCKHPSYYREEKVLKLLWTVTLYSMKTIEIPIEFKNPHKLHEEAPGFKTASYQAYYAFIHQMKQLAQRDEDLDLPDQIPFVSWNLHLEDKIYGVDLGSNSSLEKIIDLENRLPRALCSYDVYPDFIPENSFVRVPLGKRSDFEFSTQSWKDASLMRPLYYYEKPLPLDSGRALRDYQFIERVSHPWWQQNTDHYKRDYYIVRSSENKYLWVYKDQEVWYQHGIFS